MTKDADRLLAEALRAVKLNASFDPDAIGGKVGLTGTQARAAARELSNAGILVLGFDSAAHFTPDYKKAHAPPKARKKEKAGRRK